MMFRVLVPGDVDDAACTIVANLSSSSRCIAEEPST